MTSSIRKIVAAIDGSPASREALVWAARIAALHDARLYLFHAVASRDERDFADLGTNEDSRVARTLDLLPVAESLLRDARAQLGRPPVGDDANPVECARAGRDHEEVVTFAEEVEADLLVVGTNARTGLDKLLHGSVAEAIWRRAPCPVLVVRQGLAAPGHGDGRALVALEGPPLFGALRAARGLLGAKSSIDASHVVTITASNVLHAALTNDPPTTGSAENHRGELMGWIREALEGESDHVRARLTYGQPGEALLDLIQELTPDVVVCGTRGRTGVARTLLGSVAETLVRRAPCPVLICPSTGTVRERVRA